VESRFGEGQGDAPGATSELEDRPADLAGNALIERHIARDLRH
jgi:hypothetical protein